MDRQQGGPSGLAEGGRISKSIPNRSGSRRPIFNTTLRTATTPRQCRQRQSPITDYWLL